MHKWYKLLPYLQKNSEETDEYCWIWKGRVKDNLPSIHTKKYGAPLRGQAAIWAIMNEQRPPKPYVKMTCGNRKCVRPEHIEFSDTRSNGPRVVYDFFKVRKPGSGQCQFTDDQIRIIRQQANKQGAASVARAYGTTRETINKIRRRETYKWVD